MDSIKDITTEVMKNNWIISEIKLPHGIQFLDEIYDAFYLNGNYDFLYDKKLDPGTFEKYIVLTNKENTRQIKVSTLREWQTAISEGFFPMTNVDIKCSSSFTFLEKLLESLKRAKMPKVSFLDDPWIDLTNLNYLSPSIILDIEDRLKKYLGDRKTVKDLVDAEIVKVNENRIYQISLEFEGFETSLLEQFRADFNNDGIEEIFVIGWRRAVGGTMGWGITGYLTRQSNIALIDWTV